VPDLRSLLDEEASRAPVSPEGFDRTLARVRRRQRARRLTAAGVALVVFAAGLGAAVGLLESHRERPSIQPSPTAHTPLPNGEVAFKCGEAICLMRPDGTDRRTLFPEGASAPFPQWDPAWSPSGFKVAFRGYYGPEDGQYALYVADVNGCHVRRLTRDIAAHPSWSPEGERIAFDTSGMGSIYVVSANGTGLRKLTPREQEGFDDEEPAWSPDGRLIAFDRVSFRGPSAARKPQIFVMNADGTGVRQLTRGPEAQTGPAWSPDGRLIAFVSGSEPDTRIFVANADGTGVRPLTPAGLQAWSPTWTHDGRIAFLTRRAGRTDLTVVDPDGSHMKVVAANLGDVLQVEWGPSTGVASLPSSGCPSG